MKPADKESRTSKHVAQLTAINSSMKTGRERGLCAAAQAIAAPQLADSYHTPHHGLARERGAACAKRSGAWQALKGPCASWKP
jgi:hypothetical protein